MRPAAQAVKLLTVMSVREIIEQFKSLPPKEQQEVAEYVRTRDIPAAGPEAKPKRNWRAISKKIFDEHDELFRKLAQ